MGKADQREGARLVECHSLFHGLPGEKQNINVQFGHGEGVELIGRHKIERVGLPYLEVEGIRFEDVLNATRSPLILVGMMSKSYRFSRSNSTIVSGTPWPALGAW